MAWPAMLRSATRHYRQSSLLARRAAAEARRVAKRGPRAVAVVVAAHQAAQARVSEAAVSAMLAEQGLDAPPVGRVNPAAFTTAPATFLAMVESAALTDRLVVSLVQDAGRSAESVSSAARPQVGHVRYLSPPSCSRCAVLAGRFYRYSSGFQRHPGCDCVMVPTTEDASPGLVADPTDLVAEGKVTGLSKADLEAIRDGADLNQVVNVRRAGAGLLESGRVLARQGRLTPEGVYRVASSRAEAVELLTRFGYLL